MKTKRNNRINKNKTCRRGGAVFEVPKRAAVKMPKRAPGKLKIYIEPYVKELNTTGYDKYACSPSFAPENCVSNTDSKTFQQTMVENYISNYQSNLIDSYIQDNSDVNFVSGFIKTTRLNTSDKTENIINLWKPYFKKLLIDSKDVYEEPKMGDVYTFGRPEQRSRLEISKCKIKKTHNVVVSSHQHLIDKLLKWKSPKDLLELGIKKNDDKPATSPDDLEYMDKGLIYGEKKDKKMGMRNGMIIMFEFTPKKCKGDGCSLIKKDIKDNRCIDLTIKAFCEDKESSSGKNKYLYPPTEEDLINYFEKDYIENIKARLNELFNETIGLDIDETNLPNKYRLYIIRHKYSIHNKNEDPKIKDKEIKVLNSPLAYESTRQSYSDILGDYKLNAGHHNIFISSPLNRAIETLCLFLNNKNNWHDNTSPYKLDNILEKFKNLLQERCGKDIKDKKSKMTPEDMQRIKCLTKEQYDPVIDKAKDKLEQAIYNEQTTARALNTAVVDQPLLKSDGWTSADGTLIKDNIKKKIQTAMQAHKSAKDSLELAKHNYWTLVAQSRLKKAAIPVLPNGGRKTRKRKHKRKTRRRKNKKRKSRRRSIRRR